jgi:hypothetical protein
MVSREVTGDVVVALPGVGEGETGADLQGLATAARAAMGQTLGVIRCCGTGR